MKTSTSIVRGLVFDVVVVETAQLDAAGAHIFYKATIYIRENRSGRQHLIRRSRIPGTAQALARDVQQRGVQALRILVT